MSIFNIFARIDLDSSKFEAGLKRADSALVALGKNAARYFTAGAIGYGLLNLGRQAFQAAGDIADLSEQLGITTDEVQALQKAARLSGVDFAKYAEAITKIKKAQSDALTGDSKARNMFATLGVSPTDNMLDILRAAGGAKSPEQVAAAFDLIGAKTGKIMSSLESIQQLGPMELISKESADALDRAADAIGEIRNGATALTGNTLGGYANFVESWGELLRTRKTMNMEKLGAGEGAGWFRKMISSPLADIMSFLELKPFKNSAWDITAQEVINRTARDEAARMPPREPVEFGTFDWNNGVDWREGRRRNRQRKELEAQSIDGFSGLSFQSSAGNNRASIGGFFIGADATARNDIQKQQLAKQTIMADRIDKIEKALAQLTEEE